MSEDVERQIRAVADPLSQQLAQPCELMKELRVAHTERRHEKAASSRVTSSCTGGKSRFGLMTGTLDPASAPLSTFVPPARPTSPDLPPQQRVFSPYDEDEEPATNTSSQMKQVAGAINNFPAILQRDVNQYNVLYTEMANLRVSKNKFSEFDHLLRNHLRPPPHQHRITEKNKLHY